MEKTLNLQLEGLDFEFLCKFDKRYRRLSMRPQGDKFKVNVPSNISEKFLQKFILSNKHWVLKINDSIQSSLKFKVEHGAKLLFMGRESIKIYLDLDLPKKFIFEDDILFVKDLNMKIVESFLREKAASYFKLRLDYYSDLTGLDFNDFRVKDTKTRLGSCSSKKNINLSFRLMFLDPYISDYVILHEVCHLKHMNHSKAYWSLVEQFMPDYKNRIKALRQQEKQIMHYL